jgi:membrane protein YqaA with SNARE-associated domain
MSRKSQQSYTKIQESKEISISLNNSNEETDLLLKSDPDCKKANNIKKYLIIISILIITSVIVYFVFIETGLLQEFIVFIYHKFSIMYEKHPKTTCFFILFVMVINLALLLPLQSVMVFIVCALFDNYYLAFLFCLFGNTCGSCLVYLISLTKFKSFLLKHIKSNVLFRILCKYSLKYPWKTAFLTRFLFISEGIKEYLLALIGNPFQSFIVTKVLVHSLFILEICFIHMEINEIQSFINRSSMPWSERSFMEKFSTCLIVLLILFTIAFMGFIGYQASQIIKIEKEKEDLKKQQSNQLFK